MTSKGKDHLDDGDDEFEAFLHGGGALARQLSALPQPQAPAALDAAILAAVRADLTAPANSAALAASALASAKLAANDAGSGAGESADAAELRPLPAVSRLACWRMPLATAASVIGAISLMLQWQQQPESERIAPPRQSAAAPATAESTTVAAAPTVAPAPTAPIASAPAPAPAAPAHAPAPAPAPNPAAAVTTTAPAPAPAASATRAAAPVSAMSADDTATRDDGAARPHIAPTPKAAPASAGVLGKSAAAEQSVYARATSAPTGYLSAPAPATVAPPAPVAGYGAPAASDAVNVTITGSRLMAAPTGPDAAAKPAEAARAQAWLNVIDEMLKAELRRDALGEWAKFRLTYPDYPVPETLRVRIKAAQE